MFCKNCGQEINDSAVVCVHCGVMTERNQTAAPVAQNKRFIGFILSFIIAIAGLIVSIVELKKAKEEGSTTGFAIAGIIISSVSMVLSFVYYFILLS